MELLFANDSHTSLTRYFLPQRGDAEPDLFTLTLTPQTLALLAFGTFSVPELHARRMLHAPDAVLQTLELLFPERRPALTPIDYF